jgi:hypothetical protein
MVESRIMGRLLIGLAGISLLAGCAAGTTPLPSSATSAPPDAAAAEVVTPAPTPRVTATPTSSSTPALIPSSTAQPAPIATVTSAPTPTPAVVAITDLAYGAATALLKAGMLDVYAPAGAGPWPVVVMFHGDPTSISKEYLREYARRVAGLGFVVFVPAWGDGPDGQAALVTYDTLRAVNAEAACAVAFAQTHAAACGGDPATMIVFGHSAGAERAAMVAFARPAPAAGCLGGTTLGAVDAAVLWEGDWVMGGPMDAVFAVDPRVLDVATPWKYLAKHRDLKVVMLVSSNPGVPDHAFGDAQAAAAWVAARDPSGVLGNQLEVSGALADGSLSLVENQQLLFSVLKAQGNPASLDVMPGSTHTSLSDAGWTVFLDAFKKAAAHP